MDLVLYSVKRQHSQFHFSKQTHPLSFSVRFFCDLLHKIKSFASLYELDHKMNIACGLRDDPTLRARIRGVICFVLELPISELRLRQKMSLDIADIFFQEVQGVPLITLRLGSIFLNFATRMKTQIIDTALTNGAILSLLDLKSHPRMLDLRITMSRLFFLKVHLFLSITLQKMGQIESSVYLVRKENEKFLDRSIVISETGQRFICFNRKKSNDICLYSANTNKANPEGKVVTLAYNLETGEKLVSAGLRHLNFRELEALKTFQGKKGFAQMKAVVTHPSGKSRVLFEMYELADVVRAIDAGKIFPRDIISIFAQTVKAVAYMHRCGWIHRDLKPDNIFLTEKNGTMEAHLGDFGYSCLRTDVTQLNRDIGSVPYAPPELAYRTLTQQPFDLSCPEKMDVWSLGATFSKMVSTSFKRKTETLRDIAQYQEPVEPKDPNSIQFVLWHMTRVDPSLRPNMDWVLEQIKMGISWSAIR